MKISIICVGRVKESYIKDAINEFEKRISRFANIEIIEVKDEKIPDKMIDSDLKKILKLEGDKINKHIKKDTYVIALSIEGEKYTSLEFARKIQKLGIEGNSNITFIIGGSVGLSDEIIKNSDLKFSMSNLTFPHQIARLLLLEQAYRSFKIINNETYHK